jgi:hypothetical protein
MRLERDIPQGEGGPMLRPNAQASHRHTGMCARQLAPAAFGLALLVSGCARTQVVPVKPISSGFLGADDVLWTPGETAQG